MKHAIIVPARVSSTRFPQKLLHKVRGKPVLLWTADRIRSEAPEFPLWFAVDSDVLRDVLVQGGYQVIMTDPAHTCGTDRIAEANRQIGAEHVINVQADEPLVTGAQIRRLAELIAGPAEMATLGAPLKYEKDYQNPNHVKLICDAQGHAICFSRAPIPYFRDSNGQFDAERARAVPVLIHLGLYAYKGAFLEAFSKMPPGRIEQIEKLEMLRVLEQGCRIAVGVTEDALIEIDTREQAAQFEAVVKEHFKPRS
ncbi:MAG: 3-deoxy-manno-octulosonate cytidylyltransferase [Verrucomicrobia bacterium]|nr:3-deoxy-manno-octulosonate cytidylyltransferase [Verrucomicrobiota bacterium]